MAQFYPGTSQVAENRRRFSNPDVELEKLREISDEDVVKILGHRAPGEEYPSVHPPLEEIDEPDDIIREIVVPLDGAKAGDRVFFEGWKGEPEKQLNPKKKIWEMFQPGFTTTDSLEVGFDASVVKELGNEALGKLVTESGEICTVKTLKGATVR